MNEWYFCIATLSSELRVPEVNEFCVLVNTHNNEVIIIGHIRQDLLMDKFRRRYRDPYQNTINEIIHNTKLYNEYFRISIFVYACYPVSNPNLDLLTSEDDALKEIGINYL